MRTIWFVSALVLLLAACQGVSTTPFPEEYSEAVNLGDFELELTCAGQGEPTLIFENVLDFKSWPTVALQKYEEISRTCTYQRYRPAFDSAAKIDGARTALDQVKDLHNLLVKAGVPGPYILIAHGNAAWNILLYTQEYPKEVVGLVCVDCAPPGIWSTFFEKLETEQVDVSASAHQEIESFRAKYGDYRQNTELLDMDASSRMAEEVEDLGDRPFVVLAVPPTDPNIAEPEVVLIESIWGSLDQKMCNTSSNCRYEEVAGVTEETFVYHKSIVAAVKEVYEAVKEK